MATSYKTPGVYVEEIPKLPPSVAQVETALPAFIGYTENNTDVLPGDLNGKPKRIGSMVEYEQYYGYGPATIVTAVNIDDRNNFKSAEARSKFYMYDSLRMFYANGGGDCFIVSVGRYKDNNKPVDTHLKAGIEALMTEDDPTMLLFPDAVLLDDAATLGSVQVAALTHCADEARRDRFTIMDLMKTDTVPTKLGKEFKQNIGVNNLSYGAVYTPWIKTRIPKKVTYADIVGKIVKNGANVTLDSLIAADDPNKVALTAQINELTTLMTDITNIENRTTPLTGSFGSIQGKFTSLADDFNGDAGVVKLIAVVNYLKSVFVAVDDSVDANIGTSIKNTALSGAAIPAVSSDFKPLFKRLIAVDKEAADDAVVKPDYGAAKIKQADIDETVWGSNTFVADVDKSGFMTDPDKVVKCKQAMSELQSIADAVAKLYYMRLVDAAAEICKVQNAALEDALPVFKSITRGISTSMSELPPSGAMAGVYSSVDRTRGVWKSPANISLNEVLAPTEVYTKTQLDNLNVDANSGKSINAIRSFFGKGTLVYGARTLAGNDNEWRYISVRRFFIMAEESCKKASEGFVFEPNDANTWVKVQGMIENFLTTLWRQGALQGAKPEHAFYVAIGLGKTMTALDILEGRMIVEIGMAVVRPAEFIVLRFSHKMAES